jgi:hypothetical protein
MPKNHFLTSIGVVNKLKTARLKWAKVLAMVIVAVTMLLGMPQNAKAAANPPQFQETRVGPYQCVAIPGVTKVRVRALEPSNAEIQYAVYHNGNEKATYEYCSTPANSGDKYVLEPGNMRVHTTRDNKLGRLQIGNLSYSGARYGAVLVVEDMTEPMTQLSVNRKTVDIDEIDELVEGQNS